MTEAASGYERRGLGCTVVRTGDVMSDPVLLFGETLNEVARDTRYGLVRNHADLTEILLRRLHEKGLTLAQCADRRVMNRAISTLQKYAREFELAFPDYTPIRLRKKTEETDG